MSWVWLLAGMALVSPAQALKESRLWLPKKYNAMMPRLVSAALLAEQNPDCVEVVSGYLDVANSKPDEPVFRIVCRNVEGVTYSLRTSAETDEELLRNEREKRARRDIVNPIDAERGWKICKQAVTDKTSAMLKPVLHIDPPPGPVVNEIGESLFYIDFDAETPDTIKLRFTAICTVTPSGVFKVSVAPRSAVKDRPEVKPLATVKPLSTVKPLTAAKPEAQDVKSAASKLLEASGSGPEPIDLSGAEAPASEPEQTVKDGAEDGWQVESLPADGGAETTTTDDGWEVEPLLKAAEPALLENPEPSPSQPSMQQPDQPSVTEDGWLVE